MHAGKQHFERLQCKDEEVSIAMLSLKMHAGRDDPEWPQKSTKGARKTWLVFAPSAPLCGQLPWSGFGCGCAALGFFAPPCP